MRLGDVVLRDMAGAAPSEIVRVVKPDLDNRGRRHRPCLQSSRGPPVGRLATNQNRSTSRRSPSTRGTPAHESDTPVVHPLFQSVNFNQEIGTGDGLRYPRYGNSPNAEIVQERSRRWREPRAAVLLSSGMGAVACALLALLRPGDHLLAAARSTAA